MEIKRATIISITITSLITTSCAQKSDDELLVCVGSMISSGPVKKNSDGYVKLTYRILEKTFGDYDGDIIDILAYYDADKLKFAQYENCLLFLRNEGGTFYKMAIPVYDVYQTMDGRWASGAKWWEYAPYSKTSIKPGRLQFKDSVSFDLTGLSEEEINHWYPVKYYERKGSVAIPVFGNYTDELVEINKTGFLSQYFPSAKKYVSKDEIEAAMAGWRRAGILDHLSEEQILAAKAKALEENRSNLNDVLVCFPGIIYWLDTELENLDDPYAEFIRKLSAISHGAFQPANISDNFSDRRQNQVMVRFTVNNKNYSRSFKRQGDWIDTDIFGFVKQSMTENNAGGQFYELYEGGQGGMFIFLTPKQYQNLKTNGLVVFVE